MTKRPNIFFLVLAMLIVGSIYGQSDQKKADPAAWQAVQSYIRLSAFKNGINTVSLDSLRNLFDPDAMIIFDIPFRNNALKNDDIKRISKDDRQQPEVINVFGKRVSVDMYLEILEREAKKFKSPDTVLLTGKKDESRINSGTVIYEVEKQFSDTNWSVADITKYLVYTKIDNGTAKIDSIVINDEILMKKVVELRLIDESEHKNKKESLSDVNVKLWVKFNDSFNDYPIQRKTGPEGMVRFDLLANNSSKIFLDSISNSNGNYLIPYDWANGKQISEQPEGGFIIGIRPLKWNGLAYSLFLSSGALIPDKVKEENFQDESNFDSKVGIKSGFHFNITYFPTPGRWKADSNSRIFGFGSGLSADYSKAKVSSQGFAQDRYDYIDYQDDNCQVSYAGQAFSETYDLMTITVPLFMEIKNRGGDKFSYSLQAGANFSLPLVSNFEAGGTFSRWGYYDDLNPLPVKDDHLYNYFTDDTISYSGETGSLNILAEGFIKVNGFFHIFNKNPDNSLQLGLVFSMPFNQSNKYDYPESPSMKYEDYWINTGNDDYHSLIYSKDKFYRFYIGISAGINLMRYKAR